MRLLRVAPDGAHAYVEIADGPRTDDEEKEAIRVACGFPQGSDLIYYHRDKDKNCLFTFFCFSGRWLNPYMTVVLSEQSYFRELTFQQLLGIKGPVVVKKAVGGRVEEATFADFMWVYEEAFADLAESPIKCITRSFYCYLASLNKRIDMMSCDSFFETAPSCALDACTRLVLNRILVPRLLGQRPESETPEEKIARETVKEYRGAVPAPTARVREGSGAAQSRPRSTMGLCHPRLGAVRAPPEKSRGPAPRRTRRAPINFLGEENGRARLSAREKQRPNKISRQKQCSRQEQKPDATPA